jgi:hypothetical protein
MPPLTPTPTAAGAYVVAEAAKAVILAGWAGATGGTYLTDMGAPGLLAPSSQNMWTSERRPQIPVPPGIGIFVRDSISEIIDGLGAMDQTHTLEVQVWGSDTVVDGSGDEVPVSTVANIDEQAMEAALRAYAETLVQILVSANVGLTNYDLREGGTTGIYSCKPVRGMGPQRFVEALDDTQATWTQQAVVFQVQVTQRRELL